MEESDYEEGLRIMYYGNISSKQYNEQQILIYLVNKYG